MSDLGAVKREIDLLEHLQKNLADIATRSDDRRRNDLIDLRRQLAAKLISVGRVAEPVIIESGDPELLKTYRQKISNMRFTASMHQADWPAVKLGERPAEYTASAKAVRETNREFIAWMRDVLARLR